MNSIGMYIYMYMKNKYICIITYNWAGNEGKGNKQAKEKTRKDWYRKHAILQYFYLFNQFDCCYIYFSN